MASYDIFKSPAKFQKENLGKAQRDVNIALDVENHGKLSGARKRSKYAKSA